MRSRLKDNRLIHMALAATLLLGICLLVLNPFLRDGVLSLLNRLFRASEARNAYEYEMFAVADERAEMPAFIVMTLALLAAVFLLIIHDLRIAGLIILAVPAVLQAYFGLAAPAYVNAAVILAALMMQLEPQNRHYGTAYIAILAILLAVIIGVFFPGVHAGTEELSEQVRDWLGRAADEENALSGESLSEWMETRHVNEKSMDNGEKEARGTEGYRVLQVEKMQISRPDWINLLKTAMLLIGSVLLLILPFVPFIIVNMRRNRAMRQQADFDAPDGSLAVRAMFRHVVRYLSASGMQEKNVPYQAWTLPKMQEAYREQYRRAAGIWERAAYSDHPTDDDERAQVKALLNETERLLYDDADFLQRLRLRLVECLHV